MQGGVCVEGKGMGSGLDQNHVRIHSESLCQMKKDYMCMKFSIKTRARGCGANGLERKLMSDKGSTAGPSLSLSYSVSLLRKQAGQAGNPPPLPVLEY